MWGKRGGVRWREVKLGVNDITLEAKTSVRLSVCDEERLGWADDIVSREDRGNATRVRWVRGYLLFMYDLVEVTATQCQ